MMSKTLPKELVDLVVQAREKGVDEAFWDAVESFFKRTFNKRVDEAREFLLGVKAQQKEAKEGLEEIIHHLVGQRDAILGELEELDLIGERKVWEGYYEKLGKARREHVAVLEEVLQKVDKKVEI